MHFFLCPLNYFLCECRRIYAPPSIPFLHNSVLYLQAGIISNENVFDFHWIFFRFLIQTTQIFTKATHTSFAYLQKCWRTWLKENLHVNRKNKFSSIRSNVEISKNKIFFFCIFIFMSVNNTRYNEYLSIYLCHF